jgi:hypothetical protein
MYNVKPEEKIKFPLRTPWKHVVEMIYRVIQKVGLNFVSLYFKIRTSDKYVVNYIWLYSQWSL